MSAVMVSDETINCVCTINALVTGPCARRDEFGRRLLEMNSAALAARYGEELQTAADFDFRFSPRQYSKVQQYKALQCLAYQCAEGNIPERQLYQQLEKVIDLLAGELTLELIRRPWLGDKAAREAIYNTAEYNAAQWDLRPAGKVTA